jgi:hypothetical protein
VHALLVLSLLAAAPIQIPIDPREPPRIYGPQLADPIATECAIDDKRCLDEHDYRALLLALDTHNTIWCDQAVDPVACKENYDFVVGE